MLALLVSGAVVLATAPFVLRTMVSSGVIDVPNHRSSHTRATPRGGGLACLLAVAVAAAVAQARGHRVPWIAITAAVALGLVGYLDDRGSLGAAPRLVAQVVAGLVVGVAVGGPWWSVVGAVLLPVVVNTVNFMDGVNGITGLHVALWGLSAMWLGGGGRAPALVILGAVAAGSALGFLPWNAPRAKIFLGDSGSYLMGGLVASGMLVGVRHSPSLTLVLAPLTLYFVDTASALLRRALRRAPLTQAHREHTYQLLVDAGRSHLGVALVMVLLALICTAAWTLGPVVGVGVTVLVSTGYLTAPRWVAPRPAGGLR